MNTAATISRQICCSSRCKARLTVLSAVSGDALNQALSIDQLARLAPHVRQRLVLVLFLSRMEFSRRYSGTLGGALWMFVSPLLTILTIWVALEFGLSAGGRLGHNFGNGLAIGLAAWLCFVDIIQSATVSITSNPHLVKKVVFPVWVLPLASAFSAVAVHLTVLFVVTVVLWLTGMSFNLNIFLLLFWVLALVAFSSATAVILASLNVSFRDVAVIAPNLTSLLFWLTPILWPVENLTGVWKFIALLNPMAVIIEGYRYAFGLKDGGDGLSATLIFVLSTFAVSALAAVVYHRTRPAFADSL